jgi:hypothetical protein
MPANWEQRAQAKRQSRDALIPQDLHLDVPSVSDGGPLDVKRHPALLAKLTDREREITEVESVRLLLDKLASGEYTAVETLQVRSGDGGSLHQGYPVSSHDLSRKG